MRCTALVARVLTSVEDVDGETKKVIKTQLLVQFKATGSMDSQSQCWMDSHRNNGASPCGMRARIKIMVLVSCLFSHPLAAIHLRQALPMVYATHPSVLPLADRLARFKLGQFQVQPPFCLQLSQPHPQRQGTRAGRPAPSHKGGNAAQCPCT